MIKFISLLSKYRAIIFLFLAIPILGIWKLNFELIPQSDFLHFKITVKVPHTQTEEVVSRVAEPAEKVLNGIGGLISLESHSKDQEVEFYLIFHPHVEQQEAYLYIQEKIDRLKITWPRSVDQILVDRILVSKTPDIVVNLKEPIPYIDVKEKMSSFRNIIESSEPELHLQQKIVVSPNMDLLFKEKVSLPQIEQALRARGLIVSLGQKSGTVFEINHDAIKIAELEALLIGSRAHRPLRLGQVADISIHSPDSVQSIKLWLDTTKSDHIGDLKESMASFGEVLSPKVNLHKKMLVNSLLVLFLIWVIQILFSRMMFRNWQLTPLIVIFQGLLSMHFVMWSSFFHQKLNLFDVQALWLSSIIFGFLLLIFFTRVKTFFLATDKIKKTTHSMEQASLVSLMELWPCFAILLVTLYFIWSAFFESYANPLIGAVIKSFFYCATPSGLFLLLFLPMQLTKLRPKETEKIFQFKLKWDHNRGRTAAISYGMIIICVIGVFAFLEYPLAVKRGDTEELNLVRGYGAGLLYLQNEDSGQLKYQNKKDLYQVLSFSNVGLSKIGNTNMAELQQALKNIKAGVNIGLLDSGEESTVPIRLEANLLQSLGNLILLDRQGRSLLLSHLTESKYEYLDSAIYRNRLQKFNFVKKGQKNILEKVDLTTSQWTAFILDEFKKYYLAYISALVYCVLFLALYMNSFVRPVIAIGIGLSALGVTPILLSLLKFNFHIDSIAFVNLSGWFIMSLILIVTRICDTERIRGHDRDDVVEDIRVQFVPSLFLNSLCFCISIFCTSMLSRWIQPDYFSFWYDAWIVAIFLSAICYFTIKYAISLFYLESEEFIEDRAFAFLIGLRKLVRRLRDRASISKARK